jgi:hypothetical protein
MYDNSKTTLTTHHDTNNNNIYGSSETINTHNKAYDSLVIITL